MGYWARRRDRKFRNLTETASLPAGERAERVQKIMEHRSENRMRDVRKAIPVVVASIVAGAITRGLLLNIVSGNTTLVVMAASFFSAFLFMWWITVRTYVPPGIDFTQAGHLDPRDIHSMITISDYHVPRELISNINQDALNFPIMRDFGASNLCDAFDWDPGTGEIRVTPAWGANSEFEFVTRHEVYHTTREIAKVQARTINNYESYMDLEVEMRSYDRAVEKLDQIAATLFEPEDARKIMTTLRQEIEKDKKELRVRIYGEKRTDQDQDNQAPMENEALTDGKQ